MFSILGVEIFRTGKHKGEEYTEQDLDEMVAAKRAIAMRYDAYLATRDDLSPMPRPSWTESSCWLYSLRLRDEGASRSLIDHLAARKIQARTFWRSLAKQTPYRDAPSVLNGTSHSLSGTVVSLPCSSHLSTAEQDRVIAALDHDKQTRQ